MNLQKSQDRINELMSRFVAQVKGAKAMRRTDINRVSEDVLIPLFAEVYGHTDLRNLNVSECPNFPAIDLGDEKTRTAYQITSRFRSEKIKDTIKKFVDHKLYEKFDRLVIYILTEKPETYHGKGLDDIIQGKFSFDKDTDILDYRDLLEKISGFSLDKLRRVEEILEQQFGDESNLNQESTNPLDWLAQVNDSWVEDSATFKINREKLLNELLNFASGGNGVIVGGPGVGKSYLLKELHYALEPANRLHLLLPIDKLRLDAPDKLWQELSDERAMINKLKSVPTSCQKSILLFDAFDAARDEQTRQHFLNLIRRAIHTLKDSWNVVVTVRTYDAMKSQELLDLFGTPDDTEYQSEEIPCRHLAIPPLNEDEIRQAFEKIPALESIYNSASQEFKRLLAIPFNLWLLQKIIVSSQVPPDFSEIYSEVQLLDMFWQRRVEGASNGDHRWSVLERVARRMVVERSLTNKRSDISEALDLDTPTKQAAWNELQSDEILAKVSPTKQRVAFSHNIFFDYAISVLLIEDTPQQLEDFVLEDKSRPLFLRPSLTYFFTRLWYKAPDTFWNVFWHVFPSNQSVHLRLVARLIPTSVIANEAREIGQLRPLLNKLERREVIANEAMMWLLQSIRALEIKRDPLWIDFFDKASSYLHADFVWDLATLTSDIFERARDTDNTTVINTCGQIGRRLLVWIWREREATVNSWYNRLGSYQAVPLVAKTYETNVEESRTLLENVLELMQEDNFPLNFMMELTRHVDKIWPHDPHFVKQIYLAVFNHNESSDEPSGETTRLISGPVLPIISTRRQDYSNCCNRLLKHFPKFLQSAPLVAARTAIQYQNLIIGRTNIYGHLRQGAWREDPTKRFKFRGQLAYFVEDNSYIGDDRQHRNRPMTMADTLFEFIAGLSESEHSLLDSLLDVFRDEVWFAFFWRRLLKTASRFPKIFAPRLFELFTAKPILIGNDALYELGLFLQAAVSEFTPEQRLQIEETIMNLPAEDKEDRESLEVRRNLLLAQIPPTLLRTPEAKTIRGDMERENTVPENRPLESFGPVTWGRYTDEEWLQDQGVDTTTPENQELQVFFRSLDKFHSDWLNESPTEEATELILPLLREAYAAIKGDTEADKEVIDQLCYYLTACAAILGRVAGDHGSHLFDFCREVLLDGARHELPKPSSEHDIQSDFSAYSTFPRHKAAEGLLRLSTRQSDPEILDAIELLANDSVPSVRVETAMGLFMIYYKTPDRFWQIVHYRARYETIPAVQGLICTTLDWVLGEGKKNEDRTMRAMDEMLKLTLQHAEQVEPADSFIDLLMRLAISRKNSWALKTIEDNFLKSPIEFPNALNHAVYRVMKDNVTPNNLDTAEGLETLERAITFLEQVIDAVSEAIEELYTILEEHRTEETAKKLHDTYSVIDTVVMHLYFAVTDENVESERSTEGMSPESCSRYYNIVKPLMKQVIDFALDSKKGGMFAPTAYHFMQLLTNLLSCNPKEVLHFAVGVARSGEPSGYSVDSLAVEDVVKFVEIVLADHRNEVREGQGLEDLLNLLDIFAKAGWSDALKLVWRLDEVFR